MKWFHTKSLIWLPMASLSHKSQKIHFKLMPSCPVWNISNNRNLLDISPFFIRYVWICFNFLVQVYFRSEIEFKVEAESKPRLLNGDWFHLNMQLDPSLHIATSSSLSSTETIIYPSFFLNECWRWWWWREWWWWWWWWWFWWRWWWGWQWRWQYYLWRLEKQVKTFKTGGCS